MYIASDFTNEKLCETLQQLATVNLKISVQVMNSLKVQHYYTYRLILTLDVTIRNLFLCSITNRPAYVVCHQSDL